MEALAVILNQKSEIFQIVWMSLLVSGSATIIGSMIGIPLGTWLGVSDFRGKGVVIRIIYALMALPPVLAGLAVYLLFSRSGSFGYLDWLFTPGVMIIAQCMLVTPIVTGLTAAAIASKEGLIHDHAISLGATRRQAMTTVVVESRTGIISGIMTGFGRAFAEVGAVMLVGGNIRFHTRVLTTAIVMETRQGNFEIGITLGIILLIISFVISSVVLLNTEQFTMS